MPFPSFTFTSGRSSGGKGSRSDFKREKGNVHSAQEKEIFVKCNLSVIQRDQAKPESFRSKRGKHTEIPSRLLADQTLGERTTVG